MAKQIDIEKLIEMLYNQDSDLGKAANEGVNEGLFRAMHTKESGLVHYVDEAKVDKAIKYMQKKGRSAAEIKQKISSEIANGLYLNTAGKKVFLRERTEEKKEHGLLYKIEHPVQTIKSYLAPRPVDNILRAAGKFYDILKMGGDFASEKFKNAVIKLNQYDFLHPILQIAKEEKLKGINYNQTLKSINENIKKYGKDMTEGIKEMAKEYVPAKVTASILLIASFLMLGFSASNLTGFAIAGNKIPSGYPIGAGFVLLAIAFCLSFFKRKPKKQKGKAGKIKGKSK
ncbi:hypothetical protein J4433_01550 [Candidatus Pacearchaeota archaeon]|nr:hypothetical protein [Candidatus Pacearchaeota archaeon]